MTDLATQPPKISQAELVLAPRPPRQLHGLEPAGVVAARDRDRAGVCRRLWFAFFNSPPDYQMGDTVRIMYIHVPNAWLSQFVYGVMFVAALGTLVWRHPLADVAQKAAAPLGAVFTALALYLGLALGPADLGHVLGMGRTHDLDAHPVFHLSGHHRALAGLRRPASRRPHRRGGNAGRRARYSGGQILGRLVEHAAPARLDPDAGRPEDAGLDPDAAVCHDAGLHAVVRAAAFRLDAHRDPEAPRRNAEPAGRGERPPDGNARAGRDLHRLGLCRRRGGDAGADRAPSGGNRAG